MRFPFGENWLRFLDVLDDGRIEVAMGSLAEMLGRDRLDGLRFLDAGSGSGLFSLAARRLGAVVHSFDVDQESVHCTAELRRRYFVDDEQWTIESGSVLDSSYLEGLGLFDVVYCWGVLHHTGSMWRGMDLIGRRVGSAGKLFVMIYMDRGWKSDLWRFVKRTYNRNRLTRPLVLVVAIPYLVLSGLVRDLVNLRNPLARYRHYEESRGMSRMRDWIDWIGGYPYEVASRDEVVTFFEQRGFHLEREKYQEYVFVLAS